MPTVIQVVNQLDDGRPSHVRISTDVNVAERKWFFDKPGEVGVAAGGTIEWVFAGDLLVDDLPDVRVVAVEPLGAGGRQPAFVDPLETKERSSNRIVGTIFREAEGHYRYVVDVERNRVRIPLRCEPAGMGGIRVSQPPVGG